MLDLSRIQGFDKLIKATSQSFSHYLFFEMIYTRLLFPCDNKPMNKLLQKFYKGALNKRK
jgi:hypothetical protein